MAEGWYDVEGRGWGQKEALASRLELGSGVRGLPAAWCLVDVCSDLVVFVLMICA